MQIQALIPKLQVQLEYGLLWLDEGEEGSLSKAMLHAEAMRSYADPSFSRANVHSVFSLCSMLTPICKIVTVFVETSYNIVDFGPISRNESRKATTRPPSKSVCFVIWYTCSWRSKIQNIVEYCI